MWSEFNYINIKEILNRLLRHPLLSDLNLETAIQYVVDFIACMGLPQTYQDKQITLNIKDFRAILPCNCVSINQVRECRTGRCLISMTDNFISHKNENIASFKTQGSIIYTSFKEGQIEISYKALPIDDEGLPLLPDNPIFLKALELYIKKEWFTILFDMGKISSAVLQNTQQEYAFKVGQCNNEFMVPSPSEMQAITGILNQLVPRYNEFSKGFKSLGNKEQLRVQS